MTDLPTAERRAELRGLPGRDTLTDAELTALLDATEPVGDADTRLLIDKLTALIPWAEDHSSDVASAIALAASLIARQARELAEARAKLPQAQPPLLWVKLLLHYDAGGVRVEVAPDQACFPKEPTP
jgi:hypothetical protein